MLLAVDGVRGEYASAVVVVVALAEAAVVANCAVAAAGAGHLIDWASASD